MGIYGELKIFYGSLSDKKPSEYIDPDNITYIIDTLDSKYIQYHPDSYCTSGEMGHYKDLQQNIKKCNVSKEQILKILKIKKNTEFNWFVHEGFFCSYNLQTIQKSLPGSNILKIYNDNLTSEIIDIIDYIETKEKLNIIIKLYNKVPNKPYISTLIYKDELDLIKNYINNMASYIDLLKNEITSLENSNSNSNTTIKYRKDDDNL